MSGERRWTLWIGDPAYGWCVHRGEMFTEAMKVRTVEVMPVSEHDALVDAGRLVVDAEYRREQWGSDTVATFDRAIQALRESLK